MNILGKKGLVVLGGQVMIGRVIMGEKGHLHWLYWDREDNKTAGWWVCVRLRTVLLVLMVVVVVVAGGGQSADCSKKTSC